MVQVAAQEEDQAGCGKGGRSTMGSECKVQRDQEREDAQLPSCCDQKSPLCPSR